MPTYVIYARKSTESEDRQVLSIDSQIGELKRLAEQQGIRVAQVLTESKSAKAPGKRPVFNGLIERVYRGEVHGIICWKLDRLARNPVDGGSVIWALKQHGIEIITPQQCFRQANDTTILMYIELGMAQKYIDDLSRNVKRGRRTKAELGWYPGAPPIGYMNNPSQDARGEAIIPDPERFALVRRMWDLMLTGTYTPPQILDIASNAWGLRTKNTRRITAQPFARSAIYKVFSNPFYCGTFEFPRASGQWYEAKHTVMVTKEEFRRVQDLLRRTGRPRPIAETFSFTGMIRCGGCGAMVTAESKHHVVCSECGTKFASKNRKDCPRCHTRIELMSNPTTRHYVYYHCTKRKDPNCSQRGIERRELESQILAQLQRVHLPRRFTEWASTNLPKVIAEERVQDQAAHASTDRALEDCDRRLRNLVRLKTAADNEDGSRLTDKEYATQRAELLDERRRLEATRQATREDPVEEMLRAFEWASGAVATFTAGTSEDKKRVLVEFGSNLVLRDKNLLFEARRPFSVLAESLLLHAGEFNRFEPRKGVVPQREKTPLGGPCLLGRGQGDDVRTFRRWKQLVLAVYEALREEPSRHVAPGAERTSPEPGPCGHSLPWRLAA